MSPDRRDAPALSNPAGLTYVLSQPGSVADGAGAGGTALEAGAARDCTNTPAGSPCSAWDDLVPPGRIHCRPDAPGAGDRPHRPRGAAGPGARLWNGAWGDMSRLCGLDAVVPGLSSPGCAAESGGADPSPGAGPSL